MMRRFKEQGIPSQYQTKAGIAPIKELPKGVYRPNLADLIDNKLVHQKFIPLDTLVSFAETFTLQDPELPKEFFHSLFAEGIPDRLLRQWLGAKYDVRISSLDNIIYNQSSNANRSLVELASNAIDFSPEGADVSIHTHAKGYSIRDFGTGMSAQDLVLKLLIPYISGEREDSFGAIGKFGMGFYTALSHLQQEGDEVLITTCQQGSQAYQLRFIYHQGKVCVQLGLSPEPFEPRTEITINAANFSENDALSILSDHLRFNRKAVINVNDEVLNQPLEAAVRAPGTGARLELNTVQPDFRVTTAYLVVNGITMQSFTLEGSNLADPLVINLAKGAAFSESRDEVAVDKFLIKSILSLTPELTQLSRAQRVQAISTLMHLTDYLEEYDESGMIPELRAALDEALPEPQSTTTRIADLEPFRELFTDAEFLHPKLSCVDIAQLPGYEERPFFHAQGEYRKFAIFDFPANTRTEVVLLNTHILLSRNLYDKYMDSPVTLHSYLKVANAKVEVGKLKPELEDIDKEGFQPKEENFFWQGLEETHAEVIKTFIPQISERLPEMLKLTPFWKTEGIQDFKQEFMQFVQGKDSLLGDPDGQKELLEHGNGNVGKALRIFEFNLPLLNRYRKVAIAVNDLVHNGDFSLAKCRETVMTAIVACGKRQDLNEDELAHVESLIALRAQNVYLDKEDAFLDEIAQILGIKPNQRKDLAELWDRLIQQVIVASPERFLSYKDSWSKIPAEIFYSGVMQVHWYPHKAALLEVYEKIGQEHLTWFKEFYLPAVRNLWGSMNHFHYSILHNLIDPDSILGYPIYLTNQKLSPIYAGISEEERQKNVEHQRQMRENSYGHTHRSEGFEDVMLLIDEPISQQATRQLVETYVTNLLQLQSLPALIQIKASHLSSRRGSIADIINFVFIYEYRQGCSILLTKSKLEIINSFLMDQFVGQKKPHVGIIQRYLMRVLACAYLDDATFAAVQNVCFFDYDASDRDSGGARWAYPKVIFNEEILKSLAGLATKELQLNSLRLIANVCYLFIGNDNTPHSLIREKIQRVVKICEVLEQKPIYQQRQVFAHLFQRTNNYSNAPKYLNDEMNLLEVPPEIRSYVVFFQSGKTAELDAEKQQNELELEQYSHTTSLKALMMSDKFQQSSYAKGARRIDSGDPAELATLFGKANAFAAKGSGKLMERKLMHAILNQHAGKSKVLLREIVQNLLDALDVYEEGLGDPENSWLEMHDKREIMFSDSQQGDEYHLRIAERLGISLAVVFIYMLIAEKSSKADLDKLIGQFGIGFLSIFNNADKVLIRLKAPNTERIAYLRFTPSRNDLNDQVDWNVDVETKQDPWAESGTTIDIISKPENIEMARAETKSALVGFCGYVPTSRLRVNFNNVEINKDIVQISTVEVDGLSFSTYSGAGRVMIKNGLYVNKLHNDLKHNFIRRFGPVAKILVQDTDMVLEIDRRIPLTRTRNGIARKERFMPTLQKAFDILQFRNFVWRFAEGKLDYGFMPYDYFEKVYGPANERAKQLAATYNNSPIDELGEDYWLALGNFLQQGENQQIKENNLFDFLMGLQFLTYNSKRFSLFEVAEATRNGFFFPDNNFPARITSFISKAQTITEVEERGAEAIQESFGQTNFADVPFDAIAAQIADFPEVIALAKISKFVISSLKQVVRPAKEHTLTFFYSGENAVAHGGSLVGWNLHGGGLVLSMVRNLFLVKDLNATQLRTILAYIIEVLVHELTHCKERTNSRHTHTHNDVFWKLHTELYTHLLNTIDWEAFQCLILDLGKQYVFENGRDFSKEDYAQDLVKAIWGQEV
jgi:hypothetical protein